VFGAVHNACCTADVPGMEAGAGGGGGGKGPCPGNPLKGRKSALAAGCGPGRAAAPVQVALSV